MSVLENKLNNCPVLKNALVWQDANGDMISYENWPAIKKTRISEIYDKLCNNAPDLELSLPDEWNVTPAGDAYFTAWQAFDVYAAHAAHALYLEFNHLVPWSVASRPPAELAVLFSSDSYHSIIKPVQGKHYPSDIQAGRDFRETPENSGNGELNGDPRVGYRFLTGQTSTCQKNIIAENELQTLANLSVWMRDNVRHDNAPHRWLEDRLSRAPGSQVALANKGCHSASKLMVDLARSVNIPLLHARSQESNTTDLTFFSRTHGGLIHGWGGSTPLILWHTDNIYADTGEPSFPIDSAGNLLPEAEANLAYFKARWRTPSQLAQAGFNYNLHRVYPGQGFGVNSGTTDRADYGMMSGYWNKKGDSYLDKLMRILEHYEICGAYLLDMYCNGTWPIRLITDVETYKGNFSSSECSQLPTIEEFTTRAQMGIAALGGCAAFNEALANWNANLGSNLLKREEHVIFIPEAVSFEINYPRIRLRFGQPATSDWAVVGAIDDSPGFLWNVKTGERKPIPPNFKDMMRKILLYQVGTTISGRTVIETRRATLKSIMHIVQQELDKLARESQRYNMLPVEKIHGIGQKAIKILKSKGILTLENFISATSTTRKAKALAKTMGVSEKRIAAWKKGIETTAEQ
jgi:hypothetical protein